MLRSSLQSGQDQIDKTDTKTGCGVAWYCSSAFNPPLEPLVLHATVDDHSARDAWIEKVFGSRERQADTETTNQGQCEPIDSEEHSYREELQKYIAESSANLSNDDSDDDSSDEEENEYVDPPVEVPSSYRTQDLQGGVPVGGEYVLFTYWAYKRQLRRMKHLTPIPERNTDEYELPSSNEDHQTKGVYSGKIVELSAVATSILQLGNSFALQSTSMLSPTFIIELVSSVAVTGSTNAADPSCGHQYTNLNTEGDLLGTVLYPAAPNKCEVYTNVDLYVNDIKRIQGIKLGECCDECDKTMGCVGYTYVNDDPRGTQRYLKDSVDGWTKKIGVHSGTMPYLPAWSKCGDYTGFRPCVLGFYCQPWDWRNYQCIQRLRCYVETNIDFYGNDIKRVTGVGPGECCEECGKTEGCDSYTYINNDPTGTQCYLKNSNAGCVKKIGANSGLVTPVMRGT
ncbi:unnamed protein product [Phytophthora lilii]|uniref:Unnamed protein product n=1 Tax=Phytophthora lilii TaxID=2077276 RepID=A0A9W6U4Z3_9STRA|nr:unnamed protein product [Phytophthora lilii]